MTQVFAKMTRPLIKSPFFLLLVFSCLLGFTGKAFAAPRPEFDDPRYRKVDPALDGVWSFIRAGKDSVPPRKINVTFKQSTLMATGVCNTYKGNYVNQYYRDNHGEITIKTEVLKPLSKCTPDADQKEKSYFEGLQKANFYDVHIEENLSLLMIMSPSSQENFAFIKLPQR